MKKICSVLMGMLLLSLVIPAMAADNGTDVSKLRVDGEGKVAPRPVKTAEWYGKDWVVLGGLQAGDKVIIDNLIKLRPGMPVAPQTPQAPAPAAQKADAPTADKQ